MNRWLGPAVTLVLTGSFILGPPVTATATPPSQPSNPPVAAVPTFAAARVSGKRPQRVTAITRLDLYRKHDAGMRKQADYITVRTVVAPRKGRLVRGPVHRFDLDGRDRLHGSEIRVNRKTGRVRADLALTKRQRAKADSARSVRVLFLHYRDAGPGRVHEDVASVGARASHRRLRMPESTLTSSTAGLVKLVNGTANPLVIMAGPNSCMYDSIYSSTQTYHPESQLGTLNGVILLPGQSIFTGALDDKSDLDGQEADGYGTRVLADYNDALNAAYAMADAQDPQDMPELIIPEGDDESPWLDMDLSIGFFSRELVKEIIDDEGLWGAFAGEAGAEAGVSESELEAFAPFLETIATGVEFFEEPVVELVLELYTLFANSCMSHDGYMMVGATDMTHPWRQFAQVYDWNKANPKVPDPGKQGFASLANGIVGNYFASPSGTGPDSPIESSQPSTQPGSSPPMSVWTFTEADTPVDSPAVISRTPGTRRVTCQPADPSASKPAVGAVYDSLPPYRVMKDFDGNPAPATSDYLVGMHYITGAPTTSVHYSKDGSTWKDVDVPEGQTSVTLPDDGDAVLVKCDVQVAEIFSHATTSGRKALMGTRITSDIITGPDYVPTPEPTPVPQPAGAYKVYDGPRSATGALVPTEDAVWWQESSGAGILNPSRGTSSFLPNRVASVQTPDGMLWGSGTIGGKPVMSFTNPNTLKRTDFPLNTQGGAGYLTLGPNGTLYFLDKPQHYGVFTPKTVSAVEYQLPFTDVEGIMVTPDPNRIWVYNDYFIGIETSNGATQLFLPAPRGQQYWALGPDGKAWNTTSGTGNATVVQGDPMTDFCGLQASACFSETTVPGGAQQAFSGLFDARGNFWFRGQVGTNTGGAIATRMTPDKQFTQFPLKYRPATPSVLGADGRIYVGGDNYWDSSIMAISTGSDPAVEAPAIDSAYINANATCEPAQWYAQPTSVDRHWVDAATGRELADGDTFRPPNSLLGHAIQCVEVARFNWTAGPLVAKSAPMVVRGRYALSGELKQQAPVKAVHLPKRLRATGTTVLLNRPVKTVAGQRAKVSVSVRRTGSSKSAPKRLWSVVRRSGTVGVSLRSEQPLTVEVRVKAKRTGSYAPMMMTRVYQVEPGWRKGR